MQYSCGPRTEDDLEGGLVRKKLGILIVTSLLAAGIAAAQDQPNRSGDRGARPEAPQGGERGQRPGAPQGGDQGQRPGRPPPSANPKPRPPSYGPHPGPRPPHRYLSGGRWRRSMHAPPFRYPPGYGYRVWVTGSTLPPPFLNSGYYYANYAPLGLGPPPPGYRWVRYGPDLLLVNIVTGRIADVVDGVFY
jgi:Ni/Co efflux regulator RcnB